MWPGGRRAHDTDPSLAGAVHSFTRSLSKSAERSCQAPGPGPDSIKHKMPVLPVASGALCAPRAGWAAGGG